MYLYCILFAYFIVLWFPSTAYPLSRSKSVFPPPQSIAILPGSGISPSFYTEFTKELKLAIGQNIPVVFLKYSPFEDLPDNTLLIGHSFGGFIGLLYCIRETLRHDKHISACVLINSHFNDGMKMPYPPIKQCLVPQRVLVLLNTNDDKLPIERALHDLSVAKRQNAQNIEFRINSGNHTSIFTEKNELSNAVDQIVCFLDKTT